MSRSDERRQEIGRFFGETFNLLRSSPPALWTVYLAGTTPFVLALIDFASTATSGTAFRGSPALHAFVLAVLFVVMRATHAVFSSRLLDRLNGDVRPWTAGRFFRAAATQAVLQPLSLFVVPLSIVTVVPLAHLHGFFEHALVLGDGTRSTTETAKLAWREAARSTRAHLVGIWLFSPWVAGFALVLGYLLLWAVSHALPGLWLLWWVFGLFVPLLLAGASPLGLLIAYNVALLMLMVPSLLHAWFGIETRATFAAENVVLSDTFWMIVATLTCAGLDLLTRSFYALRTFYGLARRDGTDLRADYRSATGRLVAFAALLLVLVATPRPSGAASLRQNDDPFPAAQEAPGDAYEEAAQQAAQDPVYQWRQPGEGNLRETDREMQLPAWLRWLSDQLERLDAWLKRKLLSRFRPSSWNGAEGAGAGAASAVKGLMWVVIAILVVVIVVFAVKAIRARRRTPVPAAQAGATAPVAAVDVADENVGAERHPSDVWLGLVHDLMAKGEFRLALRAVFLASLASLAERQWIVLGRGRSNGDYLRDARRRAHAAPVLPELFTAQVHDFERAWYGGDPADEQLVKDALERHARLREAAHA